MSIIVIDTRYNGFKRDFSLCFLTLKIHNLVQLEKFSIPKDDTETLQSVKIRLKRYIKDNTEIRYFAYWFTASIENMS